MLGNMKTQQTCKKCHGTSDIPENLRNRCGGIGVAKESEEIDINLPASVSDEEMLRVRGRGKTAPGGKPGDLYITLHVTNNTRYTKDGKNLLTTVSIPLTEAVLGGKETLETLDNAEITVKIPAGITHGERLRIAECGVPDKQGNRGDLLITIHIDVPEKLTDKQKELLKKLKEEGL